MLKIDFDDNVPIYIQIIEHVKSEIVSKNLEAGERLPSVRDMSQTLEVNPNTVQRAYMELEREGLIFTQRGTGAFITKDEAMISRVKEERGRKVISDFIKSMEKLGYQKEELVEKLEAFMKEADR